MQTLASLPSNWVPAWAHFARYSAEQLAYEGLPAEASQLKNMLKYIHTDGSEFMYYRRAQADDKECRLKEPSLAYSKVYRSWQQAYKLGADDYARYKSKSRKRRADDARSGRSSIDEYTRTLKSPSKRVTAQHNSARFQSTNSTHPTSSGGWLQPSMPPVRTYGSWQQAPQQQQQAPMPPSDVPAFQAAVAPHPPFQNGLGIPFTTAMPPIQASFAPAASTPSYPALGGWPRPPIPPMLAPAPPLAPQYLGSGLPAAVPWSHPTLPLAGQPSPAVYTTPAAANVSSLPAKAQGGNGAWQSIDNSIPPAFRDGIGWAFNLPTPAHTQPQQQISNPNWGYQLAQNSNVVPAPPYGVLPNLFGNSTDTSSGALLQPGFRVPGTSQPQLSAGQYHATPHQQQYVASLSAQAGSSSSMKATPLYSCSSGVQEAAALGGSLSRSPSNCVGVPDPIAANADCRTGDLAAAPAMTRRGGINKVHAAAASQEPVWNLSLQLYSSDSRSPTGQQLLIATGTDLGAGGCGEVTQVDVKLYGPDSLATMRNKTEALLRLLQCTPCSCGAVLPQVKQEAGCDAFQGSSVKCCCSVQMALKFPRLYNDLSDAMRSDCTATAYQESADEATYTEFDVMESCYQSSHIVDCYALGSWQRSAGVQQLGLLMELSELGSVEKHYSINFQASKGLDGLQTQKIVLQVATRLSDLHRMASTLHRDIKWGNLLLFGSLDAPIVKICDFGISRELTGVGDYGSTLCGTLEWMPPEQADRGVGQDWRVDSFPLGLLVLALRTGLRPFWWLPYGGLSAAERARMLSTALDKPSCPYNHNMGIYTALGPLEKDFVKLCLTPDISRRPSPETLLCEHHYLLPSYAGG